MTATSRSIAPSAAAAVERWLFRSGSTWPLSHPAAGSSSGTPSIVRRPARSWHTHPAPGWSPSSENSSGDVLGTQNRAVCADHRRPLATDTVIITADFIGATAYRHPSYTNAQDFCQTTENRSVGGSIPPLGTIFDQKSEPCTGTGKRYFSRTKITSNFCFATAW